ncbi:MAG: AAA family ATPase [Flavisolibacter sp.]|jgi:NadR type nicotinamide-nucleotide adenylyltransferase
MKKIIVLGPESTGKSTLCTQLADYYKTCWCPEFAREYLHQTKGNYTFGDLLNIARGQIELEDTMITEAKNGFYFIDTDMYVMKVWCEVAFESCHTWILKRIAERKYDLFLLCNIDLPWVKDELREYPDINIRRRLYKMYKDLLINDGTKWAEISGTDSQRLQTAIQIVDTVFKRK